MEAPLVEHRPPIVKRARANSRGVSNAMDRPERRIEEGLVAVGSRQVRRIAVALVAVGSRLAAVTVRPVVEVLEEEIALATEACQAAEAHAVPAGSAAEVEAAPDPAVRVALPAWVAVGAGVAVAVAGVVVEGEEGNKASFLPLRSPRSKDFNHCSEQPI
jgi:hypothetical protein